MSKHKRRYGEVIEIKVAKESSNKKGKRVHSFRFRSADGTMEYEIPVRMVVEADKRESEPGEVPATTGATFLVAIEEPKEILVTGTDIEQLREAVFMELEQSAEIEWREYLVIEVEDPRRYGGEEGSGIEFSVMAAWQGEAHDGRKVHKIDKRFRGTEVRSGPLPVGMINGTSTSVILATKENVAAIEELTSRIEKTREALERLLAQKHIEDTLTRLHASRLLQPPEE